LTSILKKLKIVRVWCSLGAGTVPPLNYLLDFSWEVTLLFGALVVLIDSTEFGRKGSNIGCTTGCNWCYGCPLL